jgi:hypothetical protein
MSTEAVNQALAALAARGEITGALLTIRGQGVYGVDVHHRAVVYSLAPVGNREPSTLPRPPGAGRPSTNPVPEGEELDRRILAVLQAAGGTMDRSKLHHALGSRLKAARLDEAVSRLLAEGRITAEAVKRMAKVYAGWMMARATVCTLVGGQKAK